MGGAAALFSREEVFSPIPVVFWCQKLHYLVEWEFFFVLPVVFWCQKPSHYLVEREFFRQYLLCFGVKNRRIIQSKGSFFVLPIMFLSVTSFLII